MAALTKGGSEFDPAALELVEWRAQRDLGAPVPDSPPAGAGGWGVDGFDPAGRWRRWLRDAHPPRFPAPAGIEVVGVGVGDSESFAATAAFGLRLPARTEAAFAALPGKAGWRCYVARAGSAPAAAATCTDGPTTLLAVDATAEVGRRSPARAALLHRVIEDAIADGVALIAARTDEGAEGHGDAAAGLLLAGFEKAYRCPAWVDAGLPAS
ncbi:MAG TPA: hypothetical protein VMH33_09530 [Solirubrobacterales bacterium]|nr:hypothetical protein [Solirubrobacterales bacterium]